MTDEKIEDQLRKEACRLAKPFLNGEVPIPFTEAQSDGGFLALWDQGYVPASKLLLDNGASVRQVNEEMAKVKALLRIVTPSDLISFPSDMHDLLVADLKSEIENEPQLAIQRLDERVVKEISEFRVEMWSNESQHAGRPHVKVHLKRGAISISLDDEPENLTPTGGLVGEASALKVIKKHQKLLLELWYRTRPDTQKLKRR